MRYVISLAAMLAGAYAFAQTAPVPAPEGPPLGITLSEGDIVMLRDFLKRADVHVTMPDGSTHPLVDGSIISTFLESRVKAAQEAAMRKTMPQRAPAQPVPSASPSAPR